MTIRNKQPGAKAPGKKGEEDMTNSISIKEYAEYHIGDNVESMENIQKQILSRMDNIESDLKRYIALVKQGDFNGLDIFCGNSSAELFRIMRDVCRIQTMRTENAVHENWMEIFENVQNGD